MNDLPFFAALALAAGRPAEKSGVLLFRSDTSSMPIIKSEERLHLEVATAAMSLAQAICDLYPKTHQAPPCLVPFLKNYRQKRVEIENGESLRAAFAVADKNSTLKKS